MRNVGSNLLLDSAKKSDGICNSSRNVSKDGRNNKTDRTYRYPS
jgi:hypothetical protein